MNKKIKELKIKKSRILIKLTAPWGITEEISKIEQLKRFHKVWKEKIEPINKKIEKIIKENDNK